LPPTAPPATPQIIRIEPGDEELTIFVSASVGATRYVATCEGGGTSHTGESVSTSITVSGLTNDVTYSCSVFAENSVGPSGVSVSQAMIPEATSGGLPIWLLYQATQPVAKTCPSSNWTSGDYTLAQGDVVRNFRIRLPANYGSENSHPLIVAFHGWGGDEGEFLENATVQTESDQRGYILVAPLGLGGEEPDNQFSSWSFQGSTTGLDGDGLNSSVAGDSNAICDDDITTDYVYPSCGAVAENGCSWTQCTVNDAEFVASLVAAVSNNVCIDPERVYAVGGSNGGMLAWDLGREEASAEVFTGVASIVGLPHRGFLEPPIIEGGLPAISITGLRDRTVPPGDWGQETFTTTSDGDVYYYASASSITQSWAEAKGCDTTLPAQPFDVGMSEVECRGWSDCSVESSWPPVLDCRRDMGHEYGLGWSWPLILDFFDQL